MSHDLKKLDIPLNEVTKDLDDLKVSLKEATQAEDIKVKFPIEVERMDLDETKIESFDIETTTDTKSEDTIEVLMKEDQKVRKSDLKY